MQYVAVCCSVLQCVAACYSVLQCVAVCCGVLQCVAVCCSVLQCVAVRCSALHLCSSPRNPALVRLEQLVRHTATHCNTQANRKAKKRAKFVFGKHEKPTTRQFCLRNLASKQNYLTASRFLRILTCPDIRSFRSTFPAHSLW